MDSNTFSVLLNELTGQVDALVQQDETTKYTNTPEHKNQYFINQVNDLTSQIDKVAESQQLSKKSMAQLFFQKGKVQQIIKEKSYLKGADDNMSKYLKLYPYSVEGWLLLSEIRCKSQDQKGALECLQSANEMCGPNKQILRNLSMTLRVCATVDKERLANVEQSVHLAKQAVEIDMDDGYSWYILGNAYCSSFFVNQKKMDLLQLSLKAYHFAEKKLSNPNPDLFFNRAQIYNYTGDYENSINDLRTAQSLDSTLSCENSIHLIENKLVQLQQSIDNKGKLTQKSIKDMIADIPCILKQLPATKKNNKGSYTVCSLVSLKPGINQGVILSCKVTSLVSNKSDIPASFGLMDFDGNFGVISLYNSSQDLYDKINKYSNIQIIDPVFKRIQMEIQGKKIDLPLIQVFEISNFYIEGSNVAKEFIPNTLFNENYIN